MAFYAIFNVGHEIYENGEVVGILSCRMSNREFVDSSKSESATKYSGMNLENKT